ncbi:MAG: thioredoxin 2 [Actinomycetota bacterium]|jgi:thioredoxin 2|nr:thioredoxin 2 [Actinomycetota bacterium]
MSSTATGVSSTSTVVACTNCGKRNRVSAVGDGVPRCGSCHTPLPWIADADDSTFAEVADAARLPVLVDLWAPWCGPCRMVSPVLETLARERAGALKLVKVNSDVAPQVSRRFEVQAIPTLVLLKDGKVLDRQVGAAPAPVLRSWLEQHLPPSSAHDASHGTDARGAGQVEGES